MRIARKVALGVGGAEDFLTAPTLCGRRAWLRSWALNQRQPAVSAIPFASREKQD
jgi:hypothetical protein